MFFPSSRSELKESEIEQFEEGNLTDPLLPWMGTSGQIMSFGGIISTIPFSRGK